MIKRKLIIFALALIIYPCSIWSQTKHFDTTKYSIADLQEDFIFWKNKLEKKAPLLYLYNTKARTNKYFDSLYRLIDQPMTRVEFYRILAPANSFLKDQHTSIFPSTKMFNGVSEFNNLIPVDIEYIENTPVISTNYSSCDLLSIGTEVFSINGISCRVIIETLLAVNNRDGYSMTLPTEIVNEDFWFYYHLMYDTSESYEFEIKSADGIIETCTVPGMTMSEMDDQIPSDDYRDPGIYLDLIDSLSTGILTISDYSSSTFRENQGKSFKRLIAEHFEVIHEKELEVLIIDVRGNGGGHPNHVKHTLKHLLDHPFELITELRQVSNATKEAFESRTKKRWYPTLGIGTFKAGKDNFKGKIYVLMNGESASATAELVSVLNRYNRAEFIGTMTGGNPVVLSGSLTKGYWELPNTKLKAFIPNKCQILGSISSNNGLGLIPDHKVELKIEDMGTDKDLVLDYVIGLIKTNTSSIK